MRMFIKLLCIIVHRIFLFGSFQFFILWFHWPWWKRTWTHHIRIINSRHLHPWDFSGNWLLTVDSLFCNSKMRKAELVSMQKKKKSGHTYLRVCRPEAFKAINNSVLLYLTLSLVKKKKTIPFENTWNKYLWDSARIRIHFCQFFSFIISILLGLRFYTPNDMRHMPRHRWRR